MVFVKRSITVLLVATFISLASIVITSQANAQEKVSQPLLGKLEQACPMAQFIVVGSAECKKTNENKSQLIPSSAFRPTITPSRIPKTQESAIVEPIYTPQEALQVEPSGASLSSDVLFSLVNTHRQAQSLPPFERDGAVCAVAESRKTEISQEIFVTHALHSGFYAKNLPYFATENVIWQHTEAEALNWWLHSPVHRAAVEGEYKYACGVCNGEVCNMIFTSYEQKPITMSQPSTPTEVPLPSAAAASKLASEQLSKVTFPKFNPSL